MAYTTEQIEVIKNKILNALEEVIDPELGIDIVNLGLVYEIHFDGETGATVIDMTLTTMGCPLADLLTDQIHDALADVEEVSTVDVKLTRYNSINRKKGDLHESVSFGLLGPCNEKLWASSGSHGC